MAIKLEPVAGPPSDEQIKLVQTAIRLSENIANIPSMFDADLNMKLSQHLFDIHFERYIRQVAYGDLSAPVTALQAERADMSEVDVANPLDVRHDDKRNQEQGDSDMSTTGSAVSGPNQQPIKVPRNPVLQPSTASPDAAKPLEQMQPEPKQNPAELLKLGLEDTNQLLVDIRAGLKDVKQTLVVTQQSIARGLNKTCYGSYGWQFQHTLVNAEGEEPHLSGLPSLPGLQHKLHHGKSASDSDIARYLRFYDIGGEFIRPGGQPTIKEGERAAAITTLRSYLDI